MKKGAKILRILLPFLVLILLENGKRKECLDKAT